MEYRENELSYTEYCRLRESVGWMNFSAEQMKNALDKSLYVVTAVDGNRTVGMGRLIGDGMYCVLADIIVEPCYQKKGIGTEIVNMLIDFADRQTPVGGRSSIQLIAEKGKEAFYKNFGFKTIPHEFCGSGMRKVIRK